MQMYVIGLSSEISQDYKCFDIINFENVTVFILITKFAKPIFSSGQIPQIISNFHF